MNHINNSIGVNPTTLTNFTLSNQTSIPVPTLPISTGNNQKKLVDNFVDIVSPTILDRKKGPANFLHQQMKVADALDDEFKNEYSHHE